MNATFKPLTTLLIIAWAWPRGADDPRRGWLRAGLWLSLAGDIALLWPREGFVPGLVAFLLAHLAYIAGFTRQAGFAARRWPFALYALAAAAVLAQLWPGVPAALRAPVLARRAAIGGALFLASDATLAWNRFLAPVPAAGFWILASYWLAQAAIAGSLQSAANSPEDGTQGA